MNKKIFEQLILSISERLKINRDTGISITPEFVRKIVTRTINELKEDAPSLEVSDIDIEALIFKISNVFAVKVDDELIVLADPTIQRWLDSSKKDITWTHWKAYESMLKKQARSEETIKANEDVIDAVLDYSGDPRKLGPWARKGLVMGNVQSGKTQNYIGLINKAIDAGYKTIILLGGHLNDLRKQTQERVDEGVLGRESKHIIELKKEKTVPIGVGEFNINNVNSGTTTMGDFTKSFADKLGFSLTGSDPVIFTIKKHSGMMTRLYEWIIKHHYLDVKNNKKLDGPLLLIDDEADYATVNTKHHKDQITSTNEGIRNLLSLFRRSSYIGYTATPFANIFIDPDENSYSTEDDLFPSDFMVKIPVPDNYLGQSFYFNGTSEAIIPLEKNNPLYELKKADEITSIPESLKKAVRGFVLVCAIRALRDDPTAHNSMLVNVSHLKIHQNKLEYYIKEYFDELKKSYTAYKGLGVIGVRANSNLKDLEDTFYSLFNCKEEYSDVFELLTMAFNKIKVWAVNQSNGSNEKVLDYSKSRDEGLNVIVIGGHKLSRGLTLEGLSISYFTRNSKAYDTLMQMCRWFGYRPKYDDLCKLFISNESEYWYSFIAEAIDELYLELGIMRDRELTPKEFGLKVREHPGAMIITAKNKMGASVSETRSQDLWGQILRRFRFKSDKNSNEFNLKYAEKFVTNLLKTRTGKVYNGEPLVYKDEKSDTTILTEVDYEDIINFISQIDLPEDEVGDKALIHQLKGMMQDETVPKFKVAVFNQQSRGKPDWEKHIKNDSERNFINKGYSFADLDITMPKRLLNSNGKYLYKPSVNLGNSDDEKIFLKEKTRENIKSKKKKSASYDYIAAPERDFPTLIIYLFAVAIRDIKDGAKTEENFKLGHGLSPTLGYTIAIPRPEHLKGKSQAEVKKLIKKTKYSYQLNKIAQRLDTLLASIEKITANQYIRQSSIERFQLLIQQEFLRWFPWIKQSKALPIVTEKLQWLSHYARWQAQDIDDCRERYITRQLHVHQAFFDGVESNPLTLPQRRACIIDNDNNLLLAGAGTGKTSVMVGRTGYLLNSKQAQHRDILLLAYGRKAADEMNGRIINKLANGKKPTDKISATTFHSLGLYIIAQVEGAKPSLSLFAEDEKAKTKWVQSCFETLINEHAQYRGLIIEYFSRYYYVERNDVDFKSLGEYYQYLTDNDIRSLKGDKVKSFGELYIANWLFNHGIEYQYEANYAYDVSTVQRRQYRPDFFLPELNMYIEYYGIDENGDTATFIDKEEYHAAIAWKRETHQHYQTRCLELSYAQHKQGRLMSALEACFNAENIDVEQLPDEAILDSLRESGRITLLANLFSQLVGLYKAACLDASLEKNVIANSADPKQTAKALVLLKPILSRYQAHLKSYGEIDFEDMINKALSYVQAGKFESPWRYIMVDEFQDISEPRARLVRALRDNNKACSVFAVGDDWQAIYRFSGADVTLTTGFADYFGATGEANTTNKTNAANMNRASSASATNASSTTQSTLDTTFRFNNRIGKLATDFISKNPSQINKTIRSLQQVQLPAVSLLKREFGAVKSTTAFTAQAASDNTNAAKSTAAKSTAAENSNIIDEIANGAVDDVLAAISAKVLANQLSEDKKVTPISVYFLARFWFQLPSKANLERLKVQYPLLTLESQSFHASKGKEADYVIILGLKKGAYGFPSQKATPALLDALLAKEENYAYAEERRLFYVALTRAKNRVYIIADMSEASCFVKELIDEHAHDIELDEFGSAASQNFIDEINCLVCETGILKKRTGKYGAFYSCSHFPRCEHKEKPCLSCESPMTRQRFTGFKLCLNNTCNTIIPTCEKCNAEMVLRSSKNGQFWGCKNFKGNEPMSCKHGVDEEKINWPALV